MNQATALDLPRFSAIKTEQIEATIRSVLDENRSKLAALLDAGARTWETLVVPLEEMQHRLARTWSPVGHMNGVVNSDELRSAYNACLPLLTAWHTDLAQNARLYEAYDAISKHEDSKLSPGQRKLLENALRDFRLAGVALPAASKERFKALRRSCNRNSMKTCSMPPMLGPSMSKTKPSSLASPLQSSSVLVRPPNPGSSKAGTSRSMRRTTRRS
jgi:oligopeptidase A